jgi:HEAT repeat protein
MKRRNRILLAALVVVVIGGLAWVAWPEPPEPVYQGKELSIWLRPYQAEAIQQMIPGSVQYQKCRESDNAIRAIGTNAIPFLLLRMRIKDSALPRRFVQLVARQKLIKIHYTPANYLQLEAVEAFRILGASASNAVPELIKIYHENISPGTHVATIEALGSIGPGASQAVPFLLMEMRNTNDYFAGLAMESLGQIHAEPKAVVPALINVLEHGDSKVKLSAACALGKFGAAARPALPLLIEYRKSNYAFELPSGKDLLREAIGNIDPDSVSKVDGK